MKKAFSYVLFMVLMSNCSITKNQTKGKVLSEVFDTTINFSMENRLVEFPVLVNGESRKMIFDTGADFSLIAREQSTGKITTIHGAMGKTVDLGKEIVPKIQIGDVEFLNTLALNGKLEGIEQKIKNFGGLIGQPIIAKANWLFDFKNKKLQISNQNVVGPNFQVLPITRVKGRPYVDLVILGETYKVIIDLGSSSNLSIPKHSPLALEIEKKYEMQTSEEDIFSLGGIQRIEQKKGTIPEVSIGNILFENVETTIQETSQIRVGINFFRSGLLYIDNTNQQYQFKPLE